MDFALSRLSFVESRHRAVVCFCFVQQSFGARREAFMSTEADGYRHTCLCSERHLSSSRQPDSPPPTPTALPPQISRQDEMQLQKHDRTTTCITRQSQYHHHPSSERHADITMSTQTRSNYDTYLYNTTFLFILARNRHHSALVCSDQ